MVIIILNYENWHYGQHGNTSKKLHRICALKYVILSNERELEPVLCLTSLKLSCHLCSAQEVLKIKVISDGRHFSLFLKINIIYFISPLKT